MQARQQKRQKAANSNCPKIGTKQAAPIMKRRAINTSSQMKKALYRRIICRRKWKWFDLHCSALKAACRICDMTCSGRGSLQGKGGRFGAAQGGSFGLWGGRICSLSHGNDRHPAHRLSSVSNFGDWDDADGRRDETWDMRTVGRRLMMGGRGCGRRSMSVCPDDV